MLTAACCLVVGLGLDGWLVLYAFAFAFAFSGYAHVLIKLSVVVVTLPHSAKNLGSPISQISAFQFAVCLYAT